MPEPDSTYKLYKKRLIFCSNCNFPCLHKTIYIKTENNIIILNIIDSSNYICQYCRDKK